MPFSQQLIQLLSQPPGSIVYHVVTLLAIEATFGLALWQSRRDSTDSFARRLMIAAGSIFLVRLVVIVAILLTGTEVNAIGVLPPLERAIDAVTVAFLVWALVPHPERLGHLGDVLLGLNLILIGFMGAVSIQEWSAQVAASSALTAYSESEQAIIWNIFQMVLLGVGSLLVILARESHWLLRLFILITLFAAELVDFLSAPEGFYTDTDVAIWARLSYLIAFPLLAVLAYRHNLSRLLPSITLDGNGPDHLARFLRLSQGVTDSLDVQKTLRESATFTNKLFEADFTALAILSPDKRNYLQLVGERAVHERKSSQEASAHLQTWALNLDEWPAIRMALEQQQQVELVRDGIGARQLHNLYQELGISELGALLIEPLLADDEQLGVILLAGPSTLESWPTASKSLSSEVSAFVAQAVRNSLTFEQARGGLGFLPQGDGAEQLVPRTDRLDKTLIDAAPSSSQWQEADQDAVADLTRSLESSEYAGENERILAMEQEIEDLREALKVAEEAMAMAAVGQANLSPEWVMRTVSRYSGELEDAQAKINLLETRLAQHSESENFALIASQAQDLRTPLTSLGGYTDLLLNETMGILGTRQINLLRRMKANIDQMAILLDQLIDLAQPRRSPVANRVQVNVLDTIESAVNAVGAQLLEKDLKLNLDVDEFLPPIQSDDDAFYQIVTNLLTNACSVSDVDSHVSLSAHHETIREPGPNGKESLGFLHLAVTDSGGPQSRDIHGLILEAQRNPENEAAKAKLRDFGHSLPSAVTLVNSQGGRTWVSDAAGVGSTFFALLPISANGAPEDSP